MKRIFLLLATVALSAESGYLIHKNVIVGIAPKAEDLFGTWAAVMSTLALVIIQIVVMKVKETEQPFDWYSRDRRESQRRYKYFNRGGSDDEY